MQALRLALPLEGAMQRYVHDENIVRYRKLIAISDGDPSRDETRHRMLLQLLAEELSKINEPPADSSSPAE
jgi:hypothetical protein